MRIKSIEKQQYGTTASCQALGPGASHVTVSHYLSSIDLRKFAEQLVTISIEVIIGN